MEKKLTKKVDQVRKTFDEWAQNGRAKLMEKEHGKNVSKFLEKVSFEKPFSFFRCWVWKWLGSKKNFCKSQV